MRCAAGKVGPPRSQLVGNPRARRTCPNNFNFQGVFFFSVLVYLFIFSFLFCFICFICFILLYFIYFIILDFLVSELLFITYFVLFVPQFLFITYFRLSLSVDVCYLRI